MTIIRFIMKNINPFSISVLIGLLFYFHPFDARCDFEWTHDLKGNNASWGIDVKKDGTGAIYMFTQIFGFFEIGGVSTGDWKAIAHQML